MAIRERRILIVDDDADMRRVLCDLLAGLGRVCEAGDAAEGLRRVEEERPDLLILDVAMPGLGGFAVLSAVRAAAPDTTVLMLTGRLDVDTARHALDRGVNSYMTKPFEPSVLREEVKRLLEAAPGQSSRTSDTSA